jgi:hypothetical protein
MGNPTSPENGSPLNATVVTGEAEFYLNHGVAGFKLGNIKMHKNAGKATTKDRAVSVRGGGRKLAARVTTMAEQVYDLDLDEQTLENMGILFFGTTTQSGFVQNAITAPSGTASISSSLQRSVYDLGKYNVTTVVVTNAVPHTYVENTDYIVDYQRGTIYIIDGGGVANGTALSITFGCAALTMDTIQPLTTLNRSGRFVLYESDLESSIFKRIWDDSVIITATAFPEENADFSKFTYSVTFTAQNPIKQRQWVPS